MSTNDKNHPFRRRGHHLLQLRERPHSWIVASRRVGLGETEGEFYPNV
jgi:hypothetical protein